MRIGIITSIEPLGQGLHRVLARGLAAAFCQLGHTVERILLPFTANRDVSEQVWAFRTLHVSEIFDRIVALRPPAHLIPHPHKVAWLSGHPGYGIETEGDPGGQRLAAADRTALLAAERVFTTSAAAAERWARRTGVQASVLHAPPPAALGGMAQGDPDAFTVVHLGPDIRGARLPELAAALRLVQPSVRVHLCGGVNDPVAADQLALLAARLRPGCLTLDEHRPDTAALAGVMSKANAVICLSADDDVALAAIDRAAIECLPVIVSRDCPAAMERIDETQMGVAVTVDDPHSIAAALNGLAADPAWAASIGRASAGALASRPNWNMVVRAMLNE